MPEYKQSQPEEQSQHIKQSNWIYTRWVLLRLILVCYDILVINGAVYLAMITRFYVAKEMHSAGVYYFSVYPKYALVYTVACVFVFMSFRLYSGIWKYAGLNDLNRILLANLTTFVGHVAGTILFHIRMPISVYCISAVIQLVLITMSRFSYRLLLIEKSKIFNKASVNALLVGKGGTARSVIRQLERESIVRPVCMLNYNETGMSALFDGIPMIYGVENLQEAIQKYNVTLVVLASTVIPSEARSRIQKVCNELGIEVQDYSGFFQMHSGLTLKELSGYCSGAVEVVVNGERKRFEDCEDAVKNTAGQYVVKSIHSGSTIVIELGDSTVIQNDLNADWVVEQKKETGEDVSFF